MLNNEILEVAPVIEPQKYYWSCSQRHFCVLCAGLQTLKMYM